MNTAPDKKPEYHTWLTYEQAAARLGCSQKTIQRLVRSGKLTVHRRHGRPGRLIPEAEVQALEQPKPITGDDTQ